MSDFDSKSFIEKADQKLLATDDWERLEVFVELCSHEAFDKLEEESSHTGVKKAWDYLTEQKRTIREEAFSYILQVVDRLKYGGGTLPFLDQKILELELFSHERSAGVAELLLKKTRALRNYFTESRRPSPYMEAGEDARSRVEETYANLVFDILIEGSTEEYNGGFIEYSGSDPRMIFWAKLWEAYAKAETGELKRLFAEKIKEDNRLYVASLHERVSELEPASDAVEVIEDLRLKLDLFDGLRQLDGYEIIDDLLAKIDGLLAHWRDRADRQKDLNPEDKSPIKNTSNDERLRWPGTRHQLANLIDGIYRAYYQQTEIPRIDLFRKLLPILADRNGKALSEDDATTLNNYASKGDVPHSNPDENMKIVESSKRHFGPDSK